MSFPKGGGWTKIFVYLVSFPIMFPLYVTLPDTKNPASKYMRNNYFLFELPITMNSYNYTFLSFK